MTNKDNWYWIILYSIVIALYNFAFTLIVIGILDLIFFIEKIKPLGLQGFFSCYIIGYIILFILNINVLNECLKNDKEK